MNLTEFLLARIAEDEWTALPFRNRLGDVRPWRCDEIGGKVREVGAQEFGLSDVVSESDTHMTAAHIARHDPARVLAECEAKRRIVEIHALDPDPEPDENWAGLCAICDSTQEGYPCATLRALALPYAGRPDFDEAWRA